MALAHDTAQVEARPRQEFELLVGRRLAFPGRLGFVLDQFGFTEGEGEFEGIDRALVAISAGGQFLGQPLLAPDLGLFGGIEQVAPVIIIQDFLKGFGVSGCMGQDYGAQQNGAGSARIDGASGRAGARAILLSKE
jgi:hypothetical protein